MFIAIEIRYYAYVTILTILHFYVANIKIAAFFHRCKITLISFTNNITPRGGNCAYSCCHMLLYMALPSG